MKPRTTLIVAAALFAATAVIAIVLVSTSGGEKSRHHPESSEARLDSLDDPILRDQQRAAAARPEVNIELRTGAYVVTATELPTGMPIHEVIRADDPSVDSTAELRRLLERVHADLGGDAWVTVEPDPAVLHGRVVDVMETARAAGFAHLSISNP